MKARSAPLAWLAPAMLLAACIENTKPADNDNSSSAVVEPDSGPRPDPGKDSGPRGDGGSLVEGTGRDCHSNSPKTDTSCFGFYCGTNYEAVRTETPKNAACGSDRELELICEGGISTKVTECARRAAVSSGDYRENIINCIRTEPEYNDVSTACIDCYVLSAECAKNNCLSACLQGDSPGCDECRETKGCTPAFYECAGMPNPQ